MKKYWMLAALLLLCGCGQKTEPITEPTQEAIYMPTRSVATLVVPTKTPGCTNIMVFEGNENYPDGTIIEGGKPFRKEWEVKNYSSCVWDNQYRLFFISGDQMGAPDFVSIPHVPIGESGKLSVELNAPTEPGEYRSEWRLFGPDNRFFGESLTVEIVVE